MAAREKPLFDGKAQLLHTIIDIAYGEGTEAAHRRESRRDRLDPEERSNNRNAALRAWRTLSKANRELADGASRLPSVADQIELRFSIDDEDGALESERAITIGALVELHGLKAKPELIGQRGVVRGFDADSGRYRVDLDDGGGASKNVKPKCLKMISPEASPEQESRILKAPWQKKLDFYELGH